MNCRNPRCPHGEEHGRYEGFCRYCIATQWRACVADGCEQYTLHEGQRCFVHRAEDDSISIGEVSKLLGVSTKTVQRMCDEGTLPYDRTQGGHRRFKRKDIMTYLEE